MSDKASVLPPFVEDDSFQCRKDKDEDPARGCCCCNCEHRVPLLRNRHLDPFDANGKFACLCFNDYPEWPRCAIEISSHGICELHRMKK